VIDWDAHARRIHERFVEREPITYDDAITGPGDLQAVWIDEAAGDFQGFGASARRVSCEIRIEDHPERPRRGDVIVRRRAAWSVIDVTDRLDVGAWRIGLEER